MKCRICHADNPVLAGTYRAYTDYETPVYDCLECGCRFAPHRPRVYEELHVASGSPYSGQTALAHKAQRLFEANDVHGLRSLLGESRRFDFIIRTVLSARQTRRLLEVGCSKGYLTSYFVAKGYDVLGIDVSEAAVAAARECFGDHFCLTDDRRIAEMAPFDAVCHVGTVGCVASPTETIVGQLQLLRPGGLLVFNAPNIQARQRADDLWIDGTPPPDLVTLFDPEFWLRPPFSELADIELSWEPPSGYSNLKKLLKRVCPPANRKRLRPLLTTAGAARQVVRHERKRRISRSTRRVIHGLLDSLCRIGLIPAYPPEYGMFVTMVRKAGRQ